LEKWNVGNGSWLLKGIKNLTKKLLRCSIFAKTLEKKRNLKFKATKTWGNGTLEMDSRNWSKSRNKIKIEP
jgi:hypothetical protein